MDDAIIMVLLAQHLTIMQPSSLFKRPAYIDYFVLISNLAMGKLMLYSAFQHGYLCTRDSHM